MFKRKIPILAVIGRKASGKTGIVEGLISRFAASGRRVAAFKHIHQPSFTIDSPGTDSWRHAQAGAKIIVTVGDGEIAVLRKVVDTSSMNIRDLLRLLEDDALDLIVLEGFHAKVAKDGDILKIIAAKTKPDLLETLKDIAPPIIAISGPVAKEIEKSIRGIPVIDSLSKGEDLYQLVDRVIFQNKRKKYIISP